MNKYLVGVAYLEHVDINDNGSLKPHVSKGKPSVVMVQGNFCGYCTQAKPAFEKLAKMMSNVNVYTVQIDGEESDKKASKQLAAVNTSPGVPSYLGFDRNGKFVKVHKGGRDEDSLKNFALSL
jgi:thiol-disulfide isomerase/thioredoxin